jgi:hypothetical protein
MLEALCSSAWPIASGHESVEVMLTVRAVDHIIVLMRSTMRATYSSAFQPVLRAFYIEYRAMLIVCRAITEPVTESEREREREREREQYHVPTTTGRW